MLTNLGFWAVFGVVLFFICLFLMFIPDTWRGRLVVFGLCCVIAFASASLMYFTATNSQERWNDGRHTEDNGHYQLASVTDYKGIKTYYYTCEDCGHTEQFSQIMR